MPPGADEISARLLQYLSARLSQRDVAYAQPPRAISGGYDTAIFSFELGRASLAGPLILRLGKPASDPARFRLEAATQNALADMMFPTPRVFLTEPGTAALGGPFIIMERIAGRPLAHEVERRLDATTFAGKLGGMLSFPALFHSIGTRWVDIQLRLHELPPAPLMKAVADAGLDERMVTFGGQRARLSALVNSAGLAELRPGLAWLEANNPAGSLPVVICHGDFHPLNIMADEGAVTGVIDWANVVVAPAEMDVGSAIANIATVPFNVPSALRPVLRLMLGSVLRNYLRTYRRKRPLDDRALRYFQAFRAFAQLTWALAAMRAGRPGGAFGSEAGVRRLTAFFNRRAGIKIRL